MVPNNLRTPVRIGRIHMLAADLEDRVHVVRHNDESIYGDGAVMGRQATQIGICYMTRGRELHAVGYVTEKAFTAMHTDRNEIPSSGPAVPSWESSAFDAICVSVQGHGGYRAVYYDAVRL
jgi:hypothetical protein